MLDISHPGDDSPWIERALAHFGFEGWEVREEGATSVWRLYFPLDGAYHDRLQGLRNALTDLGAQVTESGQIRDEDWAENWKEFYHPLPVGQRLLVTPSWEEPSEELKAGRVILQLDPGSAFGTGYHETTRLCLTTLEGLTTDPRWTTGQLLDYGTGSGIIAIAALLLGVPRVHAADRDPVAVTVAEINLKENGFGADRFSLSQSDAPAPSPQGPYPFVVANITADVLTRLCPELVAATCDHLILSGIINKRADQVKRAYTEAGGKLVKESHDNDWLCYHFRFAEEAR